MSALTLNEYVRQTKNDSDDCKSTTSTISSARVDEACPCCQKEMQNRFIFNHLRKLHPEFVKGMYAVWKDDQMDELIKYNAPFPIEWTVKDDFDDDVTKMLWGCLGCNNTFTTQHNAMKHCLGKCKKEHNANLRRIKKEEQQDKAKREEKISADRKRWINRTPQQIFSCIQQDQEYFTNKWRSASEKVMRYLYLLKYEDCERYKYMFVNLPSIDFVDDKKNMELQEKRLDKDIIMWRREFQDILPVLWNATDTVSHSDYDELEKLINIGFPDYKF
jgi:hypothetical protein